MVLCESNEKFPNKYRNIKMNVYKANKGNRVTLKTSRLSLFYALSEIENDKLEQNQDNDIINAAGFNKPILVFQPFSYLVFV